MNKPECLVIDDFLSDNDWNNLFNQIQVDNWIKVNNHKDKYWHLTDGDVYKTERKSLPNFPFNDNNDIWFHRFRKLLNECNDVKTFVGDYKSFTARAYAYPVGSKNPWHEDMGTLTYAYYMHKEWQINWDGILLIVPYNKVELKQLLNLNNGTVHNDDYKLSMSPMEMFEQREKYKNILDYGSGYFIAPKPNRLVIINKHVVHGINRVDKDAGENIRLSISGCIFPTNFEEKIDFKIHDQKIVSKN